MWHLDVVDVVVDEVVVLFVVDVVVVVEVLKMTPVSLSLSPFFSSQRRKRIS
jgi:hypothetical protein